MTRAEKRHPESVPTDPAACDTPVEPEQPSRAEMSRRGSVGAYALAAKMSPAERSESARRAVTARWAKENERRAALGKPPTKKTRAVLDDEALAFWVAVVDEKFGTNYPWRFAEDRKRQAIAMARAEAARWAADSFARRDRGNA